MTKLKSNKSVIPDAPESNAGDDFHILWAIRKSLELLNFDNKGLKCITIEGPNPSESKEIDSTGEKLLSIDLAEYYGGHVFNTSHKVIFSQLKYSTRKSTQLYTLSRLCKNKRNKQASSIIAKLAKTFKGYVLTYGRDIVIKKVKIKLVSNQQIDDSFYKDLKAFQAFLEGNKKPLQKQILLANCRNQKNALDKLYIASNLKSGEFTDFLRVLDFEDCGTDIRVFQKHHIIKAISELSSYEVNRQFDSFHSLIWSKMMPESRNKNQIIVEDVIASFGKGNIEGLFPVPPKLENLKNYIDRECSEDTARQIKEEKNKLICIHGVAGVGKSSFINHLDKFLPLNSVTLIYDCYGQGSYLDYSSSRHVYENSITQICNDLALKIGSPFLLSSGLNDYQYIGEFQKRLEIAINILNKTYPHALLLLIIDAADNSVTAAEMRNDKCFVPGLASLQNIPDRCRLIFTSRTSRINSLELPESCHKIAIAPFELKETEQLAKHKFPNITDEHVQEFHQLTNGIPRVQSYSLENRKTLENIFEFLKPYGKKVNNIFEGQIKEAKNKLGNSQKIDAILNALIALPRPIPKHFVALVSKASEDEVGDFCLDSSSGIVYLNGFISFRDEDFENFLRNKFTITSEYYSMIADILLSEVESSEYASSNIGIVLYNSARYSELQSLVLEEKYLKAILDPLKKREIFTVRARLALNSCSKSENNEMFVKLLFLCAETSKTNKNRLNIIRNNINLVLEYSDPSSIEKLFFEVNSNTYNGAANFECAAIFSRNSKSLIFAKKHLRQAESWVEMHSRLSDQERSKYSISYHNIASGVEAYLRLYGFIFTKRWINRWQPKEMYCSVITIVLRNIISNASTTQVKNWLQTIKRKDVLLMIAVEFRKKNVPIEINVTGIAEYLIRLSGKKINTSKEFHSYVISFCEFLVEKNICLDRIIEILEKYSPTPPEHNIRFFAGTEYGEKDIQHLDDCFRSTCLKAYLNNSILEPKNFYPQKLIESLRIENDAVQESKGLKSQKEDFDELYKRLIPIYQLRTDVIVGKKQIKFVDKIKFVVKNIDADYSFAYRRLDSDGIYTHVAKKLGQLISYVNEKQEVISTLVEICIYKKRNEIPTLIDLAEIAMSFDVTQELAFKLLFKVQNLVQSNTFNATDEIFYYLKCAEIANRINKNEGSIYFQKAVESASEIDYDAYQQIDALYYLAEIIANGNNKYPRLAYELSRFVEHCSLRLCGYDKFPWETAIAAIQKLDFSSSFAIWCRWDHKDYVDILNSWSLKLKEGLKKGIIEPCQIAGLTGLYLFDYKWEELIKDLVDKLKVDHDNLKLLLIIIIKDIQTICPLDSRRAFLKLLIPIFKNTELKNGSEFKKLEELELFLNDSEKIKDGSDIEYYSPTNIAKSSNKRFEQLLKETNICNLNSLESALTQINLKENHYNDFKVDAFLERIKEICPIDCYVKHLNTFLTLGTENLSFYSFEKALKSRIESWNYMQTVKQWKNQYFENVIEKCLVEYNTDYFDYRKLNDITKLFDKSLVDLANILKIIFPYKIEKFNPDFIYQSVRTFNKLLNVQQSVGILDWILERWNKDLKNEIGEGEWHENLKPVEDSNENIALFLRYCLGHPYKSIRWRASHAVRRLAQFGDRKILEKLINLRNQNVNSSYQHKNYTYFTLSSKLWLFITLDTIAHLYPERIVPFSKMLYDEAVQKKYAHALIRKFAKSACLKLLKSEKNIYSQNQITALKKVLVSKFNKTRRERRKNNLLKPEKYTWKKRFDFDEMDTIPYWYDGLGRLFNLGGADIAHRAEKYICDTWLFVGDVHNENHVKPRDYYSTSNNHGSLPAVENLRTYFEYHSMFYVANDLLETTQQTDDEWYDWNEWLDDWGLAWNDKWLADLRDPTPLDKKFLKSIESQAKDWRWSIQSDDFEKIVGIHGSYEKEWLFVQGYYERHWREDYESVRIDSSLVGGKKASSLLNALQTVKNPHDFKLPEEEENDMEFNEDGFILKGWLKSSSSPNDGEDSFDPYTLFLDKVKILPGRGFCKSLKSKTSDDGRFTKRIKENEIVCRFENWCDHNSKAKYPPEFGTKGNRLFMKKNMLLLLLKENNYSLIIKCQINRYKKNDDIEYPPSYFKLFILNSDATVNSISRSYQIR